MLWTVNHVLSTEDRLEKLQSDAYALALRNAWWDRLVTVRPGTGKRQVFEWLLTTAQIYDLNPGSMRFDDLVTQAHELVHADRGAGLKISRNQWEDDEMAFAADWAKQIGGASALDPQYAAISLIQAGTSGLAYDGEPFFDAAHPINPFDAAIGTYRNLVTNDSQMGGSAATPNLSATSLTLAVAHMKSFKMPNGKNRNLKPSLLVVPPQLEKTALELTSAGFIGATENVMRNYRIDVIVVNEFANEPTDWYLAAEEGETSGLLPIVRSERRPYALTSYDGISQAELNRLNELQWHLRGRYGHTYGHPYQMLRVEGT
jgi:phage major head subunit gpT-like protein